MTKAFFAGLLIAICAWPVRGGDRESPAGNLAPGELGLQRPIFFARSSVEAPPETPGLRLSLAEDGGWGKKEWTILGAAVVVVASIVVAVMKNDSDEDGGGGGSYGPRP